MAKYDKTKENLRKAKEFNSIGFSRDISLQTTLKTLDNYRRGRKLYALGLEWFNAGNDLNQALDIVNIDGIDLALKDIVYFQRGYEAGLNREGFNSGYDGVSLSDLPNNYTSNRYFLEGYKDGMLKREKVESKKTK